VKRGANECEECGQDLTPAMLEKMRAHAGPWYVLEHVRPFPGVSLERIIRQIRRGLITETSIVRGPPSDYQWRFAVEIPGLCRYFGRCWQCHREIAPSDASCQHCLTYLSFEKPHSMPAPAPVEKTAAAPATSAGDAGRETTTSPGVPKSAQGESPVPAARAASKPESPAVLPRTPATEGMFSDAASAGTPADELKRLSAAVGQAELPGHEPIWDEPPRVAGIRATWVVAALLVAVVAILLIVTETRVPSATDSTPGKPDTVQPSSAPTQPSTSSGG
jgi:hypothetical protein